MKPKYKRLFLELLSFLLITAALYGFFVFVLFYIGVIL